jgi:DNA-binding transcriptional regulator YiaG
MTPSEFAAIRRRLWKNQTEAAAALGVHYITISRWENGKRKIPEMAVKLLNRFLEERR